MNPAAILEALLWTHLRVAVLLGLVYVALRAFRVRSATTRHAVWLTAIGGCLALPVLSALLPALSIPLLPMDPVSPAGSGAGAVGSVSFGPAVPEALPTLVWRIWLPVSSIFVYVVVAAIVATRFAFSIGRVSKLETAMLDWPDGKATAMKDAFCARMRIHRPVRLLRCDSIASPFTWGTLRPRVVLPSAAGDWPTDRLRNVLLHELRHVERLDWLRLCVMRVAASLFWINPFLWLAIRECRFEAERACDDFVLETGGHSPDYAEQLVDLMATGRETAHAAIALGGSDFSKRIRSILNSNNEVRAMSKVKFGTLAAGTGLMIVALAACQVTSGQPAAGDTQTAAAEAEPVAQAEPEPVAGADAARAEQEEARAVAREARAREAMEREERALAAEEQGRAIEEERRRVIEAQRVRDERERAAIIEQERRAVRALAEARAVAAANAVDNERTVAAQQEEILTLRRALDRTRMQLNETEAELALLRERLQVESAQRSASPLVPRLAPLPELSRLEGMMADTARALAEARDAYADEHPEVQRLMQQLATLEAQLATARRAASPTAN